MENVQPQPIGDPFWFDLPATVMWLRWILVAAAAELDLFRNGEFGPKVIDRACRVLEWAEARQARIMAQAAGEAADGR